MELKDPIIINPEGTTAVVTVTDDGWTHDSSYFTYTVWLKFNDPTLNHPFDDEWKAGEFDQDCRLPIEDKAREIGQKFYDFMMDFRTAYGKEDAVNLQRQKYEAAHEEILQKQRKIMDLQDIIRWREARIAELETDHVKELESEVQELKEHLYDLDEMLNGILKNVKH